MVKAPDKEIEMSSGPAIASLFGKLPGRVTLYEVGPRDGLQNESRPVPTADKIAMVNELSRTGLQHIEITSFVNPKWIPQLADASDVARGITRVPGVHYSCLVPNRRGLDSALQAGMREVAVFLSASETHNKKNVNKSIAETLQGHAELEKVIYPFLPDHPGYALAKKQMTHGGGIVTLAAALFVGAPKPLKLRCARVSRRRPPNPAMP